jgi:hypothetical protein
VTRRRRDSSAERRLQRDSAHPWRGNRVFYVAVEGEQTEPGYLSYLNREFGPEHQFVLHPLYRSNGMTPSEVVARVLEERHDHEGSQRWAMFDRDDHRDIPQAFREARRHGVQVAFSHPSFDLWLLLHFIPVSEQQHGSSEWIHEKLRRRHGSERFASASGEKAITNSRIAELRGKHYTATRYAQRIVDDCPGGDCSALTGHAPQCDPLRRDPSTDVWRLLAELGIVDRAQAGAWRSRVPTM